MASNLVKHFDKHDLLYDLQHGFRDKRSCDTQLTMLCEDLARNTSAGKQTDLILLDFSKAFDKVNLEVPPLWDQRKCTVLNLSIPG